MISIPWKNLERYAFADPAAGKDARGKRRRARQAIVVAGRDWLDRWFVLEAWAGRLTATDFLERILTSYDQWKPRRFGIEANGMQVLFGSLVREEARRRFNDVRIVPIYQPTNVDKRFRIRTGLEPAINQGRIFLSDKTGDLAIEIQGFPTAETMDVVDALETVIRMSPKMPRMQERNEESDEYAKYLRQTGCPPHLIDRKVAEFEAQAAH